MKKYLVAVLLSLTTHFALADVKPEEINKHLPGSWQAVMEVPGQRMEGNTHYNTDGTVSFEIILSAPQGQARFTGQGNWKVEGTYLVVTITESSAPQVLPVGKVMKDKVTFIDSKEFSYVDEEGTAVTEHKVNKS